MPEEQNEPENQPEVVEPAQPESTEIAKPEKAKDPSASKLDRLKLWYTSNKKISIPLTVLLFIIILAAVPFTRYAIAGTVVKKDMSVKVLDDTSATPVSGAQVSTGSVNAITNASGVATLKHISVGPHDLTVTKKYYKDKKTSLTLPVMQQKSIPTVQIEATGRQVQVTVTDSIDKSAVAGVSITVAGTNAKTDSGGVATMVVPTGANEQKATLTQSGYNDTEVTLKISSDKILNNEVKMTPAGKVYFLSKLSGKIDVVKTNLDGTERKTVLAGTGKEEDQNTVLLASRDWKYLALLSRRAGSNPTLYLIDTSNDSSSVIDEGNAAFTLVGWVGQNFVYTVERSNVGLWQADRHAIKSFNAPSKKIVTLDQTTATGTSNYNYVGESLGTIYGYDDQIYYIKNWGSSGDVGTKQATFNSIKTDGTAKKTIKSFGLSSGSTSSYISVEAKVEKPDKTHFYFYDGAKDNFYIYSDGQFKTDTTIKTSSDFFTASYPTFLQSPSDKNTFWSEPRDGKNTLFIGDDDGNNEKQITTLSDYNTFGWYTDNYLLVSKNSSELYAMSKDGKNAIKISDYHKPAVTFQGYGGGYGGL
ncbi:hypothetical protein KW792_00630 [Candidatus Saccharibacteria bacterium]|nr:hypothetical protein [Candidatus Saccharibacteria bacterium]